MWVFLTALIFLIIIIRINFESIEIRSYLIIAYLMNTLLRLLDYNLFVYFCFIILEATTAPHLSQVYYYFEMKLQFNKNSSNQIMIEIIFEKSPSQRVVVEVVVAWVQQKMVVLLVIIMEEVVQFLRVVLVELVLRKLKFEFISIVFLISMILLGPCVFFFLVRGFKYGIFLHNCIQVIIFFLLLLCCTSHFWQNWGAFVFKVKLGICGHLLYDSLLHHCKVYFLEASHWELLKFQQLFW